jgi:hypothetical protein
VSLGLGWIPCINDLSDGIITILEAWKCETIYVYHSTEVYPLFLLSFAIELWYHLLGLLIS